MTRPAAPGIVVAGEALVDLVVRPDGVVAACLGGGPYNVARTIGRLGGAGPGGVQFLGALSTDHFGRQFAAQLADDGVGHDPSLVTTLPTTLAIATLDHHGAASYQFYTEATSAPSVDHVPQWPAPAAVHAGTLGLVLEPMATTVLSLLAGLPAHTVVMLDPNCRPMVIGRRDHYLTTLAAAYARSHVVKLSLDDVGYLAPDDDPVDYATEVLAHGPRAVLLTAGGDGTTVVTPAGTVTIAPPAIQVVDSIGAGDSFGGAFLTWWMEHTASVEALADLDLVTEATVAAHEVSSLTCQRVGAQPPVRRELSARWQRAR